jgi:plasmid stabilization system protein ParE
VLADLEAIAEYVALENPAAAAALLDRVLRHVDQLGPER